MDMQVLRGTIATLAASGGLAVAPPALADESETLMRRSGCFKCHAVERAKLGPAYREVAEKYRSVADAEQRLFVHLTTGPAIKVDGQEEKHVAMTTATESQVRAVARWILSR
jgi:cytochrome c